LLQRFRPRQPIEAEPDDSLGELFCRLWTRRDGVGSLGQRDRTEPLDAASKATSSRCSMLPAKRCSISANVIEAASRTRLCAAVPDNSATASSGSRAIADAGSTLAPRPLASRNAPFAPRLLAMRSG
jgi:hypothetical protein